MPITSNGYDKMPQMICRHLWSINNQYVGLIVALSLLLHVAPALSDDAVLRVATTSSTENSGLMARLIPDFESLCACKIRMLVSGSGQALSLGKRGDVDVLLTHAPAAEEQFMREGFGSRREQVMYNDFVLLGPANDPAQLSALSTNNSSVHQWMQGFAQAANKAKNNQVRFVSRGDGSGTHQKELALWEMAGLGPDNADNPWYIEAGSGMGQTLLIADELRAYTLSDRGTYLAFRDKVDLHILGKDAPALHNPYSAIMVNPKKHPHVKHHLAAQFLDWLVSSAVQEKIGRFRFDNEVLFYPKQ